MRLLSASLLALAACARSVIVPVTHDARAPASYNGIRFLHLTPSSDSEVSQLNTLISEWQLEVLTEHGVNVNTPVDILVPAAKKKEFDTRFGADSYTVVHEDLGAAIAEEKKGFAPSRAKPPADLTWFTSYHLYNDHIAYIYQLQANFPGNSEIITAGSSIEGRAITGIHIYGSGGKGSKPAIVLHGTVHAREWISTPTVEYLTYQLLNGYANSTDVKTIVDTYDFYIFPVANPDGFSWAQTNARLWRKNRHLPPSGSDCYGVDLNRNWNIHWSDSGGASTDPCSETYKGTKFESEPEIQGLSAFSQKLIDSTGIKLYIDFHSYGQLLLYPWGYECTVNPEGPYYQAVGNTFATALGTVRGTTYTIEQGCTLYKTTGASDDFHYGTLGVHDAYTVELPGTRGFVLPAKEILPIARETWEGIFAVLKAGGFGG